MCFTLFGLKIVFKLLPNPSPSSSGPLAFHMTSLQMRSTLARSTLVPRAQVPEVLPEASPRFGPGPLAPEPTLCLSSHLQMLTQPPL